MTVPLALRGACDVWWVQECAWRRVEVGVWTGRVTCPLLASCAVGYAREEETCCVCFVPWAVGCGLWAVGCGLWAVGCGLWGAARFAHENKSSFNLPSAAVRWTTRPPSCVRKSESAARLHRTLDRHADAYLPTYCEWRRKGPVRPHCGTSSHCVPHGKRCLRASDVPGCAGAPVERVPADGIQLQAHQPRVVRVAELATVGRRTARRRPRLQALHPRRPHAHAGPAVHR